MRLLIVRHGDPDYSIDSLTEKGWKEAEYLSERLSKLDVKDFYVSPLGRAKDTASFQKDLLPSDKTVVRINYRQTGVGGDDTWSLNARAHEEFRIKGDGTYHFVFEVKPE